MFTLSTTQNMHHSHHLPLEVEGFRVLTQLITIWMRKLSLL